MVSATKSGTASTFWGLGSGLRIGGAFCLGTRDWSQGYVLPTPCEGPHPWEVFSREKGRFRTRT